jgi:hypothetical protein
VDNCDECHEAEYLYADVSGAMTFSMMTLGMAALRIKIKITEIV